MLESFKKDVLEGLSKTPKSLPSKYFYDKIGDELFVKIMNMPEYYLTDAELEVFQTQKDEIIQSFSINGLPFELIELGAGDGTKTIELLKGMIHQHSFKYIPVDISANALQQLEQRLLKQIPDLHVETAKGDYFHILEELSTDHYQKVILFLGSNLGNIPDPDAAKFLKRIADCMQKGDILLLGADLKKSEDIILPAYNDSTGITKAFNLNLLHRINHELGGNFNLKQFQHAPHYDSEEGIAYSYLKSTQNQSVFIEALDCSFAFEKDELIHTEISRKYNTEIITNLIEGSGLKLLKVFYDKKNYYGDFILIKN